MLRRRSWLAPVTASALTVALGAVGVWGQAARGEGLTCPSSVPGPDPGGGGMVLHDTHGCFHLVGVVAGGELVLGVAILAGIVAGIRHVHLARVPLPGVVVTALVVPVVVAGIAQGVASWIGVGPGGGRKMPLEPLRLVLSVGLPGLLLAPAASVAALWLVASSDRLSGAQLPWTPSP